ncbi:MAG: penicillin acylase family protein [Bacteroidota bacterium]
MKFIRLLLTAFVSLGLIYVLDNRFADLPYLRDNASLSSIPSLGKLCNPFGGFWTNAESTTFPKSIRLRSEHLEDEVKVMLDDRLVPHIFASNETDLYYAQGYITAQYRLWQMDFLTYVAAGRISELLGERGLDYDLKQRRIGMLYAAEASLKELEEDEKSKAAIQAFSQGVNDYIDQLSPANYPLEYKILGYAPEKWDALKVILILKYMAQDLSFRNNDLRMTNLLHKFGSKEMKQLFRGYSPLQDPIIPKETEFNFRNISRPQAPKEISYPLEEEAQGAAEDKSGIGSNNWAISADKSSTGYPILANDPHLSLNLPSIWFEIQLVTPKLNVYGVSIPGTPGVIIGFNKDVAWGVTNVGSDVLDWYKIKFKDDKKEAYWHDETWKPVEKRIEEIKIRNGETRKDTILFTHHGPIAAQEGEEEFAKNNNFPLNAALRWLAHDVSNEFLTFYNLNRARNYSDYRKALSYYTCPAQNFIFADNSKNIAITANGKFPKKWNEQGKYVLDGSNPEHDWQDWVPYEQNPHVRNPERGFVSSANQFPVVDSLYPYYLDWTFANYMRGKRINDYLANLSEATPDSLRLLQYDHLGQRAKDLLPYMIKYTGDLEFYSEAGKAWKLLEEWDFHYGKEQVAPTIFEVWWDKLEAAIWKDDMGEEGLRFPRQDLTQQMVMLGDSARSVKWFDDINTDSTESLRDLLIASFKETIEELEEERGPIGELWKWTNYRNTAINHLIPFLEPFSVRGINSPGCRDCVNAISTRTGPSWRMIVALGQKPKAYVIYPGGQSGNPGSHYYNNFIPVWNQGELADALYLTRSNEKSDRIISRILFVK